VQGGTGKAPADARRGAIAPRHRETRAGELCRSLKVQDPERLADLSVRLRRKREALLLTPGLLDAIRAFIVAGRDAWVRDVRDDEFDGDERFFGLRKLDAYLPFPVAGVLQLGGERPDVSPFLLRRCGLRAQLVLAGADLLDLADEPATGVTPSDAIRSSPPRPHRQSRHRVGHAASSLVVPHTATPGVPVIRVPTGPAAPVGAFARGPARARRRTGTT
jgi:hypothetical protein